MFTIYKDYTFKAVVYNPYNYDVKYEWIFPAMTRTIVRDHDDRQFAALLFHASR